MRVEKADKVPLKETEVGRVPEHWEMRQLQTVADLVSGGTPSKGRADYWNGLIPWASPKDMKRPRLHDTEDHISQVAAEDGSRVVPAGSLFIVIRGMILANDLPIALAMVPMAFNQDMKAILPKSEVDPEYLLYALVFHKSRLIPEIGTSAHGTKRIGTAAVSELLLPLPPLAEQKQIAAALCVVDRKMEVERGRKTAFDSLFKSLLHNLMTGKVRVNHLKLPT